MHTCVPFTQKLMGGGSLPKKVSWFTLDQVPCLFRHLVNLVMTVNDWLLWLQYTWPAQLPDQPVQTQLLRDADRTQVRSQHRSDSRQHSRRSSAHLQPGLVTATTADEIMMMMMLLMLVIMSFFLYLLSIVLGSKKTIQVVLYDCYILLP